MAASEALYKLPFGFRTRTISAVAATSASMNSCGESSDPICPL